MAVMMGTRGISAEMNVTPLVDVLLVLLVIFMMITPQNSPHGLEAKIPQDAKVDPPPKQVDSTVVLRLQHGANDETFIRINQEAVAWSDLRSRLHDIYKARATKVMFIHGDKQVAFSHVARAMDLAREADSGIAIGLITHSVGSD